MTPTIKSATMTAIQQAYAESSQHWANSAQYWREIASNQALDAGTRLLALNLSLEREAWHLADLAKAEPKEKV